MRLDEINARLAAIQQEAETASGDALTALENEAAALTAERQQILNEMQARQRLRSNIAAGIVTGRTIEAPSAAEPTQARFTVDSAEYREAYLMHLQGRSLSAEQRAAVTATAAIPTQTLNRIVGVFDQNPILSRITMTYIPGNITIPVEGTVNSASWVAVGTASTDSADTINSVSLGAYMLIKTVEITADVQTMSIDAFETWLVGRLANKLEAALDAAVFTGTGSSQATGILKTLDTATGTFTKAKATYADLIKIIAALPTGYATNAVFVMPRKLFYTDVIGITDTQGQPVVHADVESPAKHNILGYPVILDDNLTADNILFGELSYYHMNIARAPEVTSDDSVAFRAGSRVYRAMALADGKLTVSAAVVRFNRAAT